MKTSVLTPALAVAVLLGGTVLALAESGPGKMGHGMRMQHSFEELDADADGRITQEEMTAHMQAQFEGADADGDGALSRDELVTRMTERQAERIAAYANHMIERHDSDGDGKLSPDEMKADRGGRMFKRADADGDGAITKAEFDEMREEMQNRHQGKKAKQ
jgi:Ca2+-binding EF-hand superfamily protein